MIFFLEPLVSYSVLVTVICNIACDLEETGFAQVDSKALLLVPVSNASSISFTSREQISLTPATFTPVRGEYKRSNILSFYVRRSCICSLYISI